MRKRIGLALLGVLGVALFGLAAGLAMAHRAIRRERVALPPAASVAAAAASGPIRLSMINTASQPMPRSAVLDAGADPRPQQPYVMSHPSFVLEWADGGVLLVDVGMNREQAVAFGKPLEWLAGAQPLVPLGSVAEHLGSARAAVRGAVFTHLHSDHVGGIVDLCHHGAPPLRVPMTRAQAERPNYTTRPGLRLLHAAGCVRPVVLPEGSLLQLADFPGVFVIPAGGHTPGSQIIVAVVGAGAARRTYVFVGDIVNNIDGINADVPKPFLYRMLMVPEDNARQAELRRYLRSLRDMQGVTLLVSHDQQQLEQSGVPAWTPRA